MRNHWTGKITAGMMLLVCFVIAYKYGMRSRIREASNAGLMVEEKWLDFGETWESNRFQWTIPIKNESNHDIEIERFATSCNCMSVKSEALVVRPGDSADVHLTLDLRQSFARLQASTNAYSEVPFKGQIIPVIKNTDRVLQGWVIRGIVRRWADVSSEYVVITQSKVKKAPTPTRVMEVTCRTEVDKLTAYCGPHWGVIDAKKLHNDPKRYQISVAFNPSLPLGEFQFDIALNGMDSKGQSFTSDVRIRGHVEEDVQLVPSTLLLGRHFVGEEVSQEFMVYSVAHEWMDVERIEKRGGIAIDKIGGSANPSQRWYQVGVQIQKEGSQSISIPIHIRREDGKVTMIQLKLIYYGQLKESNTEDR